MELLQLSTFGHGPDLIAGVEEFGSLRDGQVKVDITVALKVILPDLLTHECQNLILHLIVVHEALRALGEVFGHLKSPFDLSYIIQIDDGK